MNKRNELIWLEYGWKKCAQLLHVIQATAKLFGLEPLKKLMIGSGPKLGSFTQATRLSADCPRGSSWGPKVIVDVPNWVHVSCEIFGDDRGKHTDYYWLILISSGCRLAPVSSWFHNSLMDVIYPSVCSHTHEGSIHVLGLLAIRQGILSQQLKLAPCCGPLLC